MDAKVPFGGVKPGDIPATIITPEDRQWHSLEADGYPGVEFKVLNIDELRHSVHFLARMAPGSEFPIHKHMGNAFVYTVEGSWDYEEGHMPEGSFIIEQQGSVHTPSTKTGCILMAQLTSNTDDLLEQTDDAGEPVMLGLDFFRQCL